MIICKGCNKQDTVKLENGKLICEACEFVVNDNFTEVNGAVLGNYPLSIDIEKNSFLFINNVTEDESEGFRLVLNQYFPEKPYEGCREVMGYKITGSFKIEVYYG